MRHSQKTPHLIQHKNAHNNDEEAQSDSRQFISSQPSTSDNLLNFSFDSAWTRKAIIHYVILNDPFIIVENPNFIDIIRKDFTPF